jgi:hypothetical protein
VDLRMSNSAVRAERVQDGRSSVKHSRIVTARESAWVPGIGGFLLDLGALPNMWDIEKNPLQTPSESELRTKRSTAPRTPGVPLRVNGKIQ